MSNQRELAITNKSSQPSSYALQVSSKAVMAPPRQKPQKKVLDEEEYIGALQNIIERDFFPDLPKLRTQLEWLEAEENRDFAKMNEILHRLKASRENTKTPQKGNSLKTPSSFTPIATPITSTTNDQSSNLTTITNQPSQNNKPEANHSLDSFQMLHTSEDNASFDQIMEVSNERRRQKYKWLTEKEKETQQLLLEGPQVKTAGVLTWNYTAKNLLMYNADGVPFSQTEEQRLLEGPPKEIRHTNTRFQRQELESINKPVTAESRSNVDSDKIDLDVLRGFAEKPGMQSPQVGGYKFMVTPSPAPGVDASPFTTWGSIEGTPLLLDPTDTPLRPNNGPSFKVPEVRARETLGIELAEKAMARQREAANKPKPVPKIGTPSRLLASSPLHTDMQLRASYRSSLTGKRGTIDCFYYLGSHHKDGPTTPSASPASKRLAATPSPMMKRTDPSPAKPKPVPVQPEKVVVSKKTEKNEPSVNAIGKSKTDNLLNI